MVVIELIPPTNVSFPIINLTPQLIYLFGVEISEILQFPEAHLSVTGDTANRLGCYSAESCALYPQESFPPLCPRTAWCLKTGRTKQGLPKSSSGPLPVPIQSYRSSTSRSTVRPESRLGSTKPEPIMPCGCTGKLPVNGVSIRLFVAG